MPANNLVKKDKIGYRGMNEMSCHDLIIVEAGLWVNVVITLFPLILYMFEFSLIKVFLKAFFPKGLEVHKHNNFIIIIYFKT